MNQLKDAIRREKKEIERYEKLHGPVPVVKVNTFPLSILPRASPFPIFKLLMI